MYNIEISESCKKQFINLEKKAQSGSLSKSEMILLKRFCRCLFRMMENPYNSVLRTSILYSAKSFLKKINAKYKDNCYHSHLENFSGISRRIYWHPAENSINILGIFNHLKSVNSSIKFQIL